MKISKLRPSLFCLFVILSTLSSLHADEFSIIKVHEDIELPAYSVSINNIMEFYYDYSDDTITFAILYKVPNQFFSLGIGTSMLDSDIWGFSVVDKEVRADDYWSVGPRPPILDTERGGSNDLTLLGYQITTNYTLVKCKRALVTGDESDLRVPTTHPFDVIWAGAFGGKMTFHGPKAGGANIYLVKDPSTHARDNINYTIFIHAILMFCVWGLMVDASLIIVRHKKGEKTYANYMVVHGLLMGTVVCLTYIVISIVKFGGKRFGIYGVHNEQLHFLHYNIGWFTFYSSAALAVGGVLLLLASKQPNQVSYLQNLKFYHSRAGYTIYFITRIEMLIGSFVAGRFYSGVLILYISGIIYYHTYLTNLRKIKTLDEKTKHIEFKIPFRLSHDQKELVAKINSKMTREEIHSSLPHMRWVLYGNYILDLTNWIHPGGNFIIETVYGREVSQFIHGAYSVEKFNDQLPPHRHTSQAFNVISKSIIGCLQDYEEPLVRKEQPFSSHYGAKWILKDKDAITNKVSRFEFFNENIQIKPYLTTLNSFGRHILLSLDGHQLGARNYSIALGMTNSNIFLRESILESIQGETSINIREDLVAQRQTLPIFIKKYAGYNGISKRMHDLDLDDQHYQEFSIEGPIGRGLELNNESEGIYTLIACGTGIFAYADFLHYLFMKSAYEALKKKELHEEAEKILKLGFDFDKNRSNMTVKLIAVFSDETEAYCVDMVREIGWLNHNFHLNLFDATINIGDASPRVNVVNSRLNEASLKALVDTRSNCVYVCGSPVFNKKMFDSLEDVGINSSKIKFL